jgi:anaerobic selenocysteine-containing dehydrogenase
MLPMWFIISVVVKAWVSPRVRPGLVWMPLHDFGGGNLTNQLTIDKGDPITGTAEYKVCAVRVEAA